MTTEAVTAPKPRIRADVVLGPALRSGDSVVHHVKDRRTGWFYKIGPREHFIISRLDGTRTLDDIAAEYAAEFSRALGPQHWAQMFTLLGKRQMIDGATDENALAALSQAHRDKANDDRSPLRRRFALTFPDAWCTAVASRLRYLWSLWFVLPVSVLAVAVEVLVIAHTVRLAGDVRAAGDPWVTVPADIAGIWLLIALHELGHGLTCARFGGSVTEIGVMWRFPMLVPYCKTDDMMLFATRRQRVATAFAGMFTGLVLLLPLWAWWTLSTPGSAPRAVAAVLLLVAGGSTLTSLLPFLQLDGYHMLNNALGFADLRKESQRYWSRALFARAASRTEPRRAVLIAYGLANGVFLAGAYAALCVLWFHRLEHWMSPALAGLVLGVETLVFVALFGFVRRPRATAPATPATAAPTAGIGES